MVKASSPSWCTSLFLQKQKPQLAKLWGITGKVYSSFKLEQMKWHWQKQKSSLLTQNTEWYYQLSAQSNTYKTSCNTSGHISSHDVPLAKDTSFYKYSPSVSCLNKAFAKSTHFLTWKMHSFGKNVSEPTRKRRKKKIKTSFKTLSFALLPANLHPLEES